MRDLVLATARALRQRIGRVVLVAITIALPGEALAQAPDDSSGLISLGGSILAVAATAALVVVLSRDQQSTPLPWRVAVSRVVSATVETVAAFFILSLLLVVPLALAFALIVSLVHGEAAISVAFIVLTMSVLIATAPLGLVVPVCLNEAGGPWWALNRAWAISRPRRGQARLLLGGSSILVFGVGLLVSGPDQTSSVLLLIVSVLGTVLIAGFLAVLYGSLASGPSWAVPNRAAVRDD